MNNKETMEQKNKILPELRFPEFVKDGEWKLTSIGEIGNFYYGKSAPKWSLSEEAPTLCVRYGELYTKFDTIITDVKSRTNIEPSDLKFSKGGEILVPRVGERATDFAKNCCYLPYANIAIGEMISVFETKEFALFYTHYFRTLWREFAEVVEGQNVKNLYYINLEPIKIGKPSYEEQQKIADCLSSLDELIAAYKDKLEALKNHKKGLLQNLFPQEGQTVPNYRFPEFMNDGDWEIKTVSEVAYYENGKAHEQHIVINGKYKVVNSKFISTDGEVVKYTNEALCLADENDTLMVLSDVPNGRAIAKCFYVDKNNIYTVNQRICKLKPLDINGKILYYLLNRNPYFLAFDDGVKQTNLKNDDVLNCEIVLPKKTKIQKEQQKIAECLMAVDNLIKAQTEKIEQLKAHKKGLMQGLFPKIEE
jgi:type I restriction enzyme S subunit